MTKLSEQLRAAQSYHDKIRVLELAINAIILKFEELDRATQALAKEHDQLKAEHKGLVHNYDGRIENLQERITVVEDRPSIVNRKNDTPPPGMTIKAMLARTNKVGDKAVGGALKFFAQEYCREHGLAPRTHDAVGKKTFEWWPIEAAEYAMKKVREGL